MSRSHLAVAISAAALLAMAHGARAQNAVPQQVWFHNIDPATEAQRTAKYGLPKYADATSRLEAELQASADLAQLPTIKARMEELVTDASKAEALLGKGYTVIQVQKTPRDVWDRYMDTLDGLLAATNASLRIREERGIDKLNFKPPTAVRFEDGVAHRIELGINLPMIPAGQKPSKGIFNFFRRTRNVPDNPMRELKWLYPGRDVTEFFEAAVDIRQERAIYEIHHDGSKVGEFTVDKVIGRDPHDSARTVEFGRVELEGDHITLQPTAAQAQRLKSTTWKGPHRARDTWNAALVESPEVQNVHRMASLFNTYLGTTAAGESKYAQARRMLGLPMPTAKPILGSAAFPRSARATQLRAKAFAARR